MSAATLKALRGIQDKVDDLEHAIAIHSSEDDISELREMVEQRFERIEQGLRALGVKWEDDHDE
jgi:hypothetical protein